MFQKIKKSKGFTLIEMLVVIAIIAVLVSIIIPVVGNSTTKAKAATDAANLRSMQSTITIEYLNSTDLSVARIEEIGKTCDDAPACKTNSSWVFKYDVDANGNVTTYFTDNTEKYGIDSFAAVAADGSDLKAMNDTTTHEN